MLASLRRVMALPVRRVRQLAAAASASNSRHEGAERLSGPVPEPVIGASSLDSVRAASRDIMSALRSRGLANSHDAASFDSSGVGSL